MEKLNWSKSLRKYIRLEKARIRREVFDVKGQEEKIKEFYQKIILLYKTKQPKVIGAIKKDEHTRTLQPGNTKRN